jgi:predicted  nucleic acid-binding Zn-ribbon protein
VIEPQNEVNMLVAVRNLGDPMRLLPGVEQLDCEQLAAELAEKHRALDLFASQIRVVEGQHTQISAAVATAQAAKGRRATELEAAVRRANTDERALNACTNHGIGMVNGECTIQERFYSQSQTELTAAIEALTSATNTLQDLQVKESEISAELVSLKADHLAIEGEIDQIILIMGQKSCPLVAA